jgi:hypothetical protein
VSGKGNWGEGIRGWTTGDSTRGRGPLAARPHGAGRYGGWGWPARLARCSASWGGQGRCGRTIAATKAVAARPGPSTPAGTAWSAAPAVPARRAARGSVLRAGSAVGGVRGEETPARRTATGATAAPTAAPGTAGFAVRATRRPISTRPARAARRVRVCMGWCAARMCPVWPAAPAPVSTPADGRLQSDAVTELRCHDAARSDARHGPWARPRG